MTEPQQNEPNIMKLLVAREKPNISLLYINDFFYSIQWNKHECFNNSSFLRHLIQYIFDDAAKNLEAQVEGVGDSKAHRDRNFGLAEGSHQVAACLVYSHTS